jgi:hypothetical protein
MPRSAAQTSSPAYDSVLTLAWPFVTLTPSCFALVTISMRFLAETACEILGNVSPACTLREGGNGGRTLRQSCCCA